QLTMETHYTKHHAAYTNNLNAAVEKDSTLAGKSIEEILSNLEAIKDEGLRTTIRNNGGGYVNHNLYFSTLSPNPATAPTGALLNQIKEQYKSLEGLQEELAKQAAGRFGSGWAFLVAFKDGSLKVVNTPNQDTPLMDKGGGTPILGIDVWEHAYYLKYKNLRAEYIKAFFKALDWKLVELNYQKVAY
ncbi:MAG: superoxide dismutase, partial [Spirochaetia bacterium]|nr:superoxide dismutase [Spirochaetia bacterium]